MFMYLQHFNSFNSEDSYIYFGRLPVERKYLQRTFIKTAWDVISDVYSKICSDGLTFEDNVNIKGYRSLPSDAQIARVRVERLPLIHPVTLREQIKRRFSAFGEVLDIGFIKDGECFVGQGHVVLNHNPICAEVETFEKLSRVIDWIDGQRDLLLTWDEMPPYCRFCQKEDHCRADCKELLKTKHCFNCNEKGHIIRDCPRRIYNPPIVAHKRIPVQTRPVSSRGESIQLKKPLTLAPVPENRHLPTASVEQNILQNPTESLITHNHQPQCSSPDGSIHIAKRAKHNIEHYPNDDNNHLSESVGDDDTMNDSVDFDANISRSDTEPVNQPINTQTTPAL
ncbi:hypothetical protein CU098_006828 [Rhizopus stolonifer]|uniref:CCHC-type domain-containing protein n=1 Tax=Rhizopus stolonifer TaxID=4846 RepID=A0A367KBK6_RHIST|nr:hypothetical protein CU098_006828 [Rhizopus stolonifer]